MAALYLFGLALPPSGLGLLAARAEPAEHNLQVTVVVVVAGVVAVAWEVAWRMPGLEAVADVAQVLVVVGRGLAWLEVGMKAFE